MTSTPCRAAASSASSPGHGSSGLRMSMAQSIRSPKRSKQSMTSSVKPFAGPGAPQAGVGKAREPLGPLALALVEVVADRADQRVGVAVDAGERAAEQGV